jgi:hypothetical protein
MYRYFIVVLAASLFSCQKSVYNVERSSGLNFKSGTTFAIIQNDNENQEEGKLTNVVRKHLLHSGLSFDNVDPQLLVSLSYDEVDLVIYICILNAHTYQSIWKGKVLNKNDYKSDLQFKRVTLSTLKI